MKVFVTGATGWVGSHVVPELLAHGHTVLGLARSDASAAKLEKMGALVLRGSIEDLESLKTGASSSDGVIHAGFIHDFANFADCCAKDLSAIKAIGEALAGTGKPFIVSSGIFPDKPASGLITENAPTPPVGSPRVASDHAALALVAKNVRVAIMRLPPSVHGTGDHGFVPIIISCAKQNNESVYIGTGANVWSAVHVKDAAVLYRLAVEKAPAGTYLHAIGDEAVPIKSIAEAISKKHNLPVVSKSAEDAAAHFTWMAAFVQFDKPTSSEATKKAFGWQPKELGLLEDIAQNY